MCLVNAFIYPNWGSVLMKVSSGGDRIRLPKLKFSAKISHRFARDFTNTYLKNPKCLYLT